MGGKGVASVGEQLDPFLPRERAGDWVLWFLGEGLFGYRV